MRGLSVIGVAFAALTLASCAGDPGFGLFGASTSTPPVGRVASPAAGTTPSGILGGAVGASLDEQDRQRAYAAEMQALEYGEPGLPTGWRGERSGRYGTIVPGVQYEARGTRCRDYTHTIYIDGKPQAARTSACRNPDGTWSPVG